MVYVSNVHRYQVKYIQNLSANYPLASVTRSGDLLDFGQLLKTLGNNYFAQISQILREYL